jgi:site-specific DNA-methyltransferase (adenine-specific)
MKPYYESGGITIYHGDCLEIIPTLQPESVDLLWTDPPYGHANGEKDLASSRIGVKGGRKGTLDTIQNDRQEDWERLIPEFLKLSVPVLKSDCCCCCCCGGGGPSPSFARTALWMDEWFSFFHAVVWDKSARGNGLGWRYRRNYEFVMVAHKKGGKLAWADDKVAVPNIIRTKPDENTLHPTTKPVDLVAHFIKWHTKPGDLVLDPFMGSGTTLRAAKDLGRRAIGIEIEERYCEIAVRRLAQENLVRTPDATSTAVVRSMNLPGIGSVESAKGRDLSA